MIITEDLKARLEQTRKKRKKNLVWGAITVLTIMAIGISRDLPWWEVFILAGVVSGAVSLLRWCFDA